MLWNRGQQQRKHRTVSATKAWKQLRKTDVDWARRQHGAVTKGQRMRDRQWLEERQKALELRWWLWEVEMSKAERRGQRPRETGTKFKASSNHLCKFFVVFFFLSFFLLFVQVWLTYIHIYLDLEWWINWFCGLIYMYINLYTGCGNSEQIDWYIYAYILVWEQWTNLWLRADIYAWIWIWWSAECEK